MAEPGTIKMTRMERYRSFEGKQVTSVIAHLNKHNVHCVVCKKDLKVTKLSAPTHNSLSIQLKQSDGTNLNGNPAVTCKCGYSNSVLKLLYQTV